MKQMMENSCRQPSARKDRHQNCKEHYDEKPQCEQRGDGKRPVNIVSADQMRSQEPELPRRQCGLLRPVSEDDAVRQNQMSCFGCPRSCLLPNPSRSSREFVLIVATEQESSLHLAYIAMLVPLVRVVGEISKIVLINPPPQQILHSV